MDKRAWIIFSVAVIGIFGGLIAFSRQAKIDVSTFDNAKIITDATVAKGSIADHVYGKADSKIILVQYGDFQCPGCGQLHQSMQPLLENYKDKIAFVFRNFPLTSIHPNARAAAAAAESAGLQDKYWEMNNKIYNNQSSWENLSIEKRDDMFASYAKELGLNVDQFKKDLTSSQVSTKINFDQALGKENGVNATPTLYLDGKKLDTTAFDSYSALESTLNNAVKKAEKTADKSSTDKK